MAIPRLQLTLLTTIAAPITPATNAPTINGIMLSALSPMDDPAPLLLPLPKLLDSHPSAAQASLFPEEEEPLDEDEDEDEDEEEDEEEDELSLLPSLSDALSLLPSTSYPSASQPLLLLPLLLPPLELL